MVKNRIIRGKIVFLFLSACFFFVSCGAGNQMNIKKREVQIPERFSQTKASVSPTMPPKAPDFVSATEDISPIKTRIVDIVARKTPLRDVLHVIANATSLNLVMEKDVDPETEVNLTLKNVTAQYALNTIFTSVDYFYKVEDNLLIVKAVETKSFELGHPPMTQTYAIDVGGDMLGGAMNINPTGGGGGGSGTTSVKGNVTQSIKSDETAFKFWDAVDKSLETIMNIKAGETGGGTGQAQSLPSTDSPAPYT